MAEKFDSLKTNEDNNDEIDLCDPTAKLRLPPIEIGPNEHPLQFGYALWYTRNPIGKITDSGYAQNLRLVGRFASVEQFWALYSHLLRPSELMSNSDFHLFKNGIKPMWEDVNNRLGGRFQLKLRKGLVDRCWENLLLALLGEQFMVGEEICGVVVSVKFGEDKLYVWNRKCEDTATRSRIRDTLKRVLNIPADARMKYKTHNDALKFGAPKEGDVTFYQPQNEKQQCDFIDILNDETGDIDLWKNRVAQHGSSFARAKVYDGNVWKASGAFFPKVLCNPLLSTILPFDLGE